jgi:uncharacterized membrane protein
LLKWTFLSFSPNFDENFEMESSLGMLVVLYLLKIPAHAFEISKKKKKNRSKEKENKERRKEKKKKKKKKMFFQKLALFYICPLLTQSLTYGNV